MQNDKQDSTPSSTRANEQDFLSSQLNLAQSHVDRMTPYESSHVQNVIRPNTPQPTPQSDMVAVPREVITDLQGTLNYIAVQGKANHPGFAQVARMNAEDAVKRLQPYTKGEK